MRDLALPNAILIDSEPYVVGTLGFCALILTFSVLFRFRRGSSPLAASLAGFGLLTGTKTSAFGLGRSKETNLENSDLNLNEETGSSLNKDELVKYAAQSLLEGASDVAVIAIDQDGLIQVFNSGAENLLGYRAQDIVGVQTPLLFHRSDEIEDERRLLERNSGNHASGIDVLTNSAREGQTGRREWVYLCKGGRHRAVSVSVSRIVDSADAILGYLMIASDITSTRDARRDLANAVVFDRLTGLPNRQALLGCLQSQLCNKYPNDTDIVLVLLNFNRFQLINDSLGHDVGDKLLVAISERLTKLMETITVASNRLPSDLVFRLGADEFVLLLPIDTIDYEPQAFICQLQETLDNAFVIGELQVSPSASIGFVAQDESYSDASELLRDANVAMRHAKKSGSGAEAFDTSMRRRVQRSQKLESDLARAIERSELRLVYQPIINIETGELYGVESLLRWEHHEDGLISPAEFVPIAEDSGLIISIGEWVIKEGCEQLLRWQAELGSMAPGVVNLNLSPRQLVSTDLADRIIDVVRETQIDPSHLTFELTESSLMNDPEFIATLLMKFKELGSRIAIDDFGTGHSSLASLHRFPADVLKFDQSFIRDITTEKDLASLVHAITVLARNLEIRTVAEGIETGEQYLAVSELGCDFAQGYLFSKPLEADAISEYVRGSAFGAINAVGAAMFDNRWEDQIELLSRS